MITNRIFSCLLFLFITSIELFSQSKGYVQTDSFYRQGIITFLPEGSTYQIEFQQSKRTPKIIYTPADLITFGLGDAIFFSKTILLEDKPTLVFVERLTKPGLLTLFKYKDKNIQQLFIQQDSTGALTALSKSLPELRMQLIQLTNDMKFAAAKAQSLSTREKLITLYIEHYNRKRNYPFLPVWRFGFAVGLQSRQLSFSETNQGIGNLLEVADFQRSNNFVGGAFVEMPVVRKTNTFIHASVLYSQHSYTYYLENPTPSYDLGFNIATLNIPLQVKQYFPLRGKRWLPYLALGASIDFNSVLEDFLLVTQRSPDLVEFQYLDLDEISPSTYAVISTIGAQYPVFEKHYLFVEANGSKSLPGNNTKIDRYQNFNILVGLSFRL